MFTEITPENFEAVLHGTPGALVVEFYSPTCGHCKRTEAGLRELEEPQAAFARLDVLAHPELAELYEVTNLPTLLFLKDGELKNKLIGYTHPLVAAEEIRKLL
ncbi:MAG: thioredoxin family protein [Oscillospiraceae bacterium]|nr:thioredoxin family protein [Oscillospiraceae bacterium]MBR1897559.1 thioredoxin family protein [Oscillospiraceae bacterium]